MKIQLGDILVAENGAFYRVVECGEQVISLKRLNGYTAFSCNLAFVEAQFRFAEPSSSTYSRSTCA